MGTASLLKQVTFWIAKNVILKIILKAPQNGWSGRRRACGPRALGAAVAQGQRCTRAAQRSLPTWKGWACTLEGRGMCRQKSRADEFNEGLSLLLGWRPKRPCQGKGAGKCPGRQQKPRALLAVPEGLRAGWPAGWHTAASHRGEVAAQSWAPV